MVRNPEEMSSVALALMIPIKVFSAIATSMGTGTRSHAGYDRNPNRVAREEMQLYMTEFGRRLGNGSLGLVAVLVVAGVFVLFFGFIVLIAALGLLIGL